MTAIAILQLVALLMVAALGTAVVLTRDPKRQAFVVGIYGLLQAILFYLLQSPDVALSQLAVGSIAVPALLLATLAKLDRAP
jgi:uncharacterized MnhB-related membrane protein